MRLAFVAAAFALSAANPEKDGAKPNADANQRVAKALESVAAALKQKPDATNTERPCDKHEDNRSSDLCAQWKAADAAQSAANAAWVLGIAGGVLGFFTLLVAIRAALYARDAARHTESGAVAADKSLTVAREVAAAELRAWVTIKPVLVKFTADERGLDIAYAVIFQNIGKTAARDLWVRFRAKLVEKDPVKEIQALWDEWRDMDPEFNRTLMPGEEHVGNGSSMNNAMFLPWRDWGEEKPRRIQWILVVAAKYFSDMDNEWHRVERSFTVGDNQGEGFIDHQYIPENLRGAWDGPEMDAQVIMSEYLAGETT